MPSRKIFLLYLFLIGCVPGPIYVWTDDVTKENVLWYRYNYQGVYELKVDVFLKGRETKTPSKLVLAAPREATKGVYTLHYSVPNSLQEYESNREKWTDIKGIVSKGTRIRCSRLIRYNPLGYHSSLYIFAEILDGPFAGVEAEISDLSLLGPEHEYGFLKKPNPDLLSPVKSR